jgi:hypothetical protein
MQMVGSLREPDRRRGTEGHPKLEPACPKNRPCLCWVSLLSVVGVFFAVSSAQSGFAERSSFGACGAF